MAAWLRKEGYKYVRRSKCLGVDWAGGQTAGYQGMSARLKMAARKVKRLRTIKKGGGRVLDATRAIL